MVQASLNAVAVALEREIPFHWLWILSGTTYPIASNDAIRAKLASHHPESVSAVVVYYAGDACCCRKRRTTDGLLDNLRDSAAEQLASKFLRGRALLASK